MNDILQDHADSLGAQTRSGLDLNRNGVLDLSGPDRVTESRSW
jgi:hypothetical protein